MISVRVTAKGRAVNAAMLEHVLLATRKAAFDIEAHAKQTVPVDTGNLKNSIQASPDGPAAYRVDAAAGYAIHVEFGTRHTSARPYLVPAVERVRPSYLAALKALTR